MSGSAPQPRTVAGGRGSAWVGEGFDLFRRAPGTWIGMLLVWFILGAVLGIIPGGALVNTLLNPALQAGVLLGCVALGRGEPLRIGHLFSAFRTPHLGQLLLVAVLMLACLLGVVAVAALSMAGTIRGLVTGQIDWQHVDVLRVLLAALIVAALALPVTMLAWFAPALVVLRGVPAWDAMKLSFSACLRNWLPFLVYGLVAMAILILACLPAFLGLLVAAPVLVASVYASYRDVFAA